MRLAGEMSGGQDRALIAALASLLVAALFLAGLLALWGTQVWLPRSSLTGYSVKACAGLRLVKQVEFGVAWVSPQAAENKIMPATYYWNPNHRFAVCGYIPWAPELPISGGVLFRP